MQLRNMETSKYLNISINGLIGVQTVETYIVYVEKDILVRFKISNKSDGNFSWNFKQENVFLLT